MVRSDEAEWWFNAVYSAIQEVPYGRVTSYGHIARLLGKPERSRQVGICLKQLPKNDAEAEHYYHEENVPWQRIINAQGKISPRGPGSTLRQAVALRKEDVTVHESAMGEFSVEWDRYGWFPEMLPSEEAEIKAEEEDGE